MKFKQYPKIFRVGHEKCKGIFSKGKVVVEEKMDGANVRWCYDPEQDCIRFGSRKMELTNAKDYGQFKRFAEWVKQLNPDDLVPGYIYYAEYMIPHTIQYDWSKTPMLLGFDVWDGEKFLNWHDAKSLFENITVAFVPVLDVRPVTAIDEEYLNDVIPESKYYNGLAEGVVFKNYELQLFAKLIAEPFKEMNEQVFGKAAKKSLKQTSPEEYVIEKYIPPRRIEKIITSLIDEGKPLDMSLMRELPKRVWTDVVEEEGTNILNENVTLNLKKLRKMIPKRCVNVLQRMIALKELNVL